MEDDVAQAGSTGVGEAETGDVHRRRAAHLYGLIVTGAVLAAAPPEFRIIRVALVLVGTLAIYWCAETYVHWIAARTIRQRALTRDEGRQIMRDGWPLVSACSLPLLLLAIEALFHVETKVAVEVTLAVNAVLLFGVGWRMSKAGGLTGPRLLVSASVTGLLGVAMVVLKTSLH